MTYHPQTPTSLRLPEDIRARLTKQASKEDRTVTSLIKILLADGLDVREVSVMKETNMMKQRLINKRAKRLAKIAQKGGSHASVLD